MRLFWAIFKHYGIYRETVIVLSFLRPQDRMRSLMVFITMVRKERGYYTKKRKTSHKHGSAVVAQLSFETKSIFIYISTIAVYLWLWCWADHSFNEQLINFWIRYIFSLGHQLVQFPASFTHRHDFVTQQVATRHVSVAVSDTNAIALCSFTGSGTTCNSKSHNVSIFASMLSAYLPNWNIL